MTYFISIEELKQNNVINANVDSEYIEPALREAQDIFLREIIGDTLYSTIENKINGNTLTGKYLTLVNQYIKPYLENRMLASLVVPISMKIRNAGVIQQYDQGFNSSNVKDVAYLADYYNGRVEFYENRMTEYLKKNINDIPEYAYSSQNVTNPSQTHTAGTIYLGGGRKRSCGANYGQSGGGGGSLNTVDWDNIQNRPDFAEVSFSGSYNDLEDTPEIPQPVQSDWDETDPASMAFIKNKPSVPSGQVQSDWNQTNTSEVDYIKNKPTIPTVPTNVSAFNNDAGYTTFDGDYNSLTNKPTIPAAQVQTDWNANSGMAQILNKPSLATVATSGSYPDLHNRPSLKAVATSGDYNDLTNKPTIPAAQVNSDWNANSGVAQILNKPSIPANTSDLNNDSGFITINDVPAQVNADWNSNSGASEILNKPSLATVATTGNYSDLNGTPTIPAAQVQSDWNANSGMGEILNKPSLSTVATSGDYNDLQNKPTIPVVPSYTTETWEFLLSDNTTITKTIYLVPSV